MTLSPGAKVQPKRSTFRSPAGFRTAWSSTLGERAPTPPRFIGQRTWTSRMGSSPNRLWIRDQRQYPRDRRLRIVGRHEIEVAVAGRRSQIRHQALIDPVGVDDD